MSSNDMRFIDRQDGKSFDQIVHPETSENMVGWMTKDRPKLTAELRRQGVCWRLVGHGLSRSIHGGSDA